MSSSSLQSSQAPTLDNTLGAVFLGAVGASILYGITTLQVWLYYHRFLRDSVLHRVSVATLWALDTLHQALTIHTAYSFTILSPGDPKILWSTKLQVAINVVIVLIVQSLYAYRVWILSGIHHGCLGYIVASVVGGGFVIGVVLAYTVYTSPTFPSLQNVTWAINASLATSTTIDFTIALAMCYYLRKSQGSEQRLNSKITSAMQYVLSSGLLTSAVSLSTLFTYTLMPNNLIFLGLQFLVTKFYVGSFLAMLNARQRPLPKSDSEVDVEERTDSRIHLTTRTRSWRSGTRSHGTSSNLNIQTTIHTHTHIDGDSYREGNDASSSVMGGHGYGLGKLDALELTSPSSMTIASNRSGSETFVSYNERKKSGVWSGEHGSIDYADAESDLGVGIESPASAVIRPVHAYEYGGVAGSDRYVQNTPDTDTYTSPPGHGRERRRPDYVHRW